MPGGVFRVVMVDNGNNLLRAYLAEKSERNFRAVVELHSAMVEGTAVRHLKDPVAAEDVSQHVFIRLAKKASRLSPDICLAGGLYRQACRVSLDALRSEQRRQSRENEAALAMNSKPMTEKDSLLIPEPAPHRRAAPGAESRKKNSQWNR